MTIERKMVEYAKEILTSFGLKMDLSAGTTLTLYCNGQTVLLNYDINTAKYLLKSLCHVKLDAEKRQKLTEFSGYLMKIYEYDEYSYENGIVTVVCSTKPFKFFHNGVPSAPFSHTMTELVRALTRVIDSFHSFGECVREEKLQNCFRQQNGL